MSITERDARAVGVANLQLSAELLRIAAAFDDAGIPFVVLKGMPLAERLFGRLDRRAAIDNDLLVHPRDVPQARSVLEAFGYVPRDHAFSFERDARRYNQLAFLRSEPSRTFVCELHWTAFMPLLAHVPVEVQWRMTRLQPFMHRAVRVFDDAMTIVHLAYHFAQHRFEERRILEELAAAWTAASPADRARALEVAPSSGLRALTLFSLSAARDLGLVEGGLVGPSRRIRLARRLLPSVRLFDAAPRSGYARIALVFLLGSPWRYPRFAYRSLFPTLDQLSVIYREPRSPRLYRHYVTRPVRGLVRIVRRSPSGSPMPRSREREVFRDGTGYGSPQR